MDTLTRVGADEQLQAECARAIDMAVGDADDGLLALATFRTIIDRLEIPARAYAGVVRAVEARGVRLVNEPDVDAPEERDPDGVEQADRSDASGLDLFARRARHRILSAEEEQALAERIEAGRLAGRALDEQRDLPYEVRRDLGRRVRDGQRAADEFALCNVRLVLKHVQRYRKRLTAGLELDDLVQEGYLGLAHAVQLFDPTKGFKFSTYATWWIRQSIERAVSNQGRTVRLPVHMVEKVHAYNRARAELVATGAPPTNQAVADRLGLSVRVAAEIQRAAQREGSLDAPRRDGASTYSEVLADNVATSVDTYIERMAVDEVVQSALHVALTEKQRVIIERRFGLGDCESQTLEEIGADFGVTRERIRQIEAKALRLLREMSTLLGLDDLRDDREPV